MRYKKRINEYVNVDRVGSQITVYALNHPRVVTAFISNIRDGLKKGYQSFSIHFSVADQVFPCAIVPLTGIIEYLRRTGIEIEVKDNGFIDQFQIDSPHKYSSDNGHVLNKVWCFENSTDVCLLVDSIIEALAKEDKFYKGQLDTIEWSLNEVMDNVIQHSKAEIGYVMIQIHKSRQVIAITVFDFGQGIYKSLLNTKHNPRSAADAITLAIREGVTRDNSVGQGNGLFGLYSIVNKGKGTLYITSGGGSYMLNEGQSKVYERIPTISRENPCTTIDFRLDYSLDLSINKAIIIKGKEHVIQSLRTEAFENLESTYYTYLIKERAEGTGTRESAERVKNDIANILVSDPKPVILDFTGVEVISSSFADELIAKLFMEFGLFQFNVMFKLKGLDSGQQRILQKSVLQRIFVNMQDESKSSGLD